MELRSHRVALTGLVLGGALMLVGFLMLVANAATLAVFPVALGSGIAGVLIIAAYLIERRERRLEREGGELSELPPA